MASISQDTVRYLANAVVQVLIAKEVNVLVTEPYMDEPFHIPQAQAYCRSEWDVWDPKITTPPGLYLISVAFKSVFLFRCTLPVLRFTNILLSLLIPPIITRILARVRRESPPESLLEPTPEALIIALFPVGWFFNFLYYTETGSVLFVLMCFWAALEGKHAAAALLGLASCFFRQTNIIWVAYALGFGALAKLHRPPPRSTTGTAAVAPASPLYDPPARSATIFDIIQCFVFLPNAILSVTEVLAPYAAVAAAFVGFVVWNGGIVLGDKSNHIPQIHIPQLYYFIAFSTALGLPVLVSGPGGPSYLVREVIRRMVGTRTRVILNTLLCAAMMVTIRLFTIHHPFLLSDNRHYTFYVWARVFRRHPLVGPALAPGYLVCAYAWFVRVYCPPRPRINARTTTNPPMLRANGSAVPHGNGNGGIAEAVAAPPPTTALRTTPQDSTKSLLHALLLPICLVLALLPTPLLEPRYFLIPYILLRLQVPLPSIPFSSSSSRSSSTAWWETTVEDTFGLSPSDNGGIMWGVLLEGVWYAAINYATMWVFLYKEREGVGRFMW
ncbi:hypothetical protein DL93DRAFT_786916 [Clavulina sp. PMI_390]|nr:hypothetical protein DL93DRAFT_786916 [Clavulina sp. PMI_390]